MQVIVVASSKGGVSKTTLTAALAVECAKKEKPVGLVDLDPQESLLRWSDLRKKQDVEIYDDGERPMNLAKALAHFRKRKVQWVFVDTPPALMSIIREAIKHASLVLVPLRPSPVDLETYDPVVELVHTYGKDFAFLLTQANARSGGMTADAIEYLEEAGPVAKQGIVNRNAYATAMGYGKTGPEVDDTGKAGAEIAALWKFVRAEVTTRERERA